LLNCHFEEPQGAIAVDVNVVEKAACGKDSFFDFD